MKTLFPILIALFAFAPCVYAQTGEDHDASEAGAWWKEFGDPVLDQIVEQVLESNFDLEAGVARVEQARMEARLARSARWPLFGPSVSGVSSDTPTNAGIGAQLDELGLGSSLEQVVGVPLPDRVGLNTYTASLEFAYELDFWGRNRSYARSAGASHLASQSEFAAARIGIIAETIGTYFEILNYRMQRGLAERNAEVARDLAVLAASEYDSGLVPLDQLFAARNTARTLEAEVPRYEAMQAEAEGRLWILLGGRNEDLAAVLPDSLTIDGDPFGAPEAVDADLLMQRPDVSAARLHVDAASHAVGARRAELWPRLSFQGFIGLQGTDLSEWFDVDQWFRNLTLNLVGPLIQGSRRRSQLALARAQLDEATARYGRSVVTAVSEVEATLSQLQASQRRFELLAALTEESEAQRDLLESRYNSGIVGYGQFLVAVQAHISAQALLAAAQFNLNSVQLALHRALGGSWAVETSQ